MLKSCVIILDPIYTTSTSEIAPKSASAHSFFALGAICKPRGQMRGRGLDCVQLTTNLNYSYLVKVSTRGSGAKIAHITCSRPLIVVKTTFYVGFWYERAHCANNEFLTARFFHRQVCLTSMMSLPCPSRASDYQVSLYSKGSFINHVDRNLDFLTPLPPLWTILLNRAYVVIWTFGKPLSPCHVHMVCECPLRRE